MHRSLGTHISKVRSLTLDKWDPELLLVSQYLLNCSGALPFLPIDDEADGQRKNKFDIPGDDRQRDLLESCLG